MNLLQHILIWIQPLWMHAHHTYHIHLFPNIWLNIAAGYLAAATLHGMGFARRYIPSRLSAFPFFGPLLHGLCSWMSAAFVGAFTLPFLITKTLIETQRIESVTTQVQHRLHPPTQSRILSIRIDSPIDTR